MPAIILQDRWRRQPSGLTDVDWGNPLSRGIVFAGLPTGAGLVDVSRRIGNLVATNAALFPAVYRGGALHAHDLTGSSSYVRTNPTQNALTSLPISMSILINPDGAAACRVMDVGTANSYNPVVGIQGIGTSQYRLQHYDTGEAITNPTTVSAGTWAHLVGVFSSNEYRAMYRDGLFVSSSTTTRFSDSGFDNLVIGYAPWSGVEYFDGKVAAPVVWARSLSADEIKELAANPWQVFKKSPRILYFPSAGGGGATLAADSGTYALTGTSATLKADRKLAADSGSYAITGTDVSLKLGRKLTAESGSYALTGTDVSLILGRKIVADSGTYTVNGTTVSLTVGRKLVADSGTYSLTGTDVTLTYQPAGGYTLALDSGSYTLTGTAATLKASRKLTADSGTYALTGTDVTLTRGFKITADSGTYTLTGSNVAFARTYRLPADSGSYTLTGSPVSLSWSGEVVPVAPTHGGPSIYGKAVFREKEFKREYEREVSRIENERIRAIQMREDEEIVIIMAALAA